MTSITSRAVLVQLKISQWTARKYDKRATQEVAASNNAKLAAGRYNKSLLPMTDALKLVHQKSSEVRTKYYDNTLPWGMDGTQLLPTANYIEFMTKFRTLKNQWLQLVTDFLQDYDKHKAAAQAHLGTLYDPADYPTQQELGEKFDMDMAVMPVPDSDFRVDIDDTELANIQQDVEERVNEAHTKAMREVWQRLYDRVQHMSEKLSDPSAIFRDTLVESTRDLCELLPRLNMDDDPNLINMKQAVEFRLSRWEPDALRHDPDLRRTVADDAAKIMDKMRGFMEPV